MARRPGETAVRRAAAVTLCLWSCVCCVRAFATTARTSREGRHPSSSSSIGLVPLRDLAGAEILTHQTGDPGESTGRSLNEEGDYVVDGDGDAYTLCLVEDGDLPDLSRFIVACFGADAIRLSQDTNELERFLLSPTADLLNGYSSLVAFAEVLSGLKQRAADRLERLDVGLSPDVVAATADGSSSERAVEAASRDSLVLALARNGRGATDSSRQHTDIIASVELRLQPCDAKIPFTLPWLDKVERGLARIVGTGSSSSSSSDKGKAGTPDSGTLQPYLSNLCVSDQCRGRGIGRSLVRCVERIASSVWRYDRMYLHVDEDNEAALRLYKSEGYRDVKSRWNPVWAGEASRIGYFAKDIGVGVRERKGRNEIGRGPETSSASSTKKSTLP